MTLPTNTPAPDSGLNVTYRLLVPTDKVGKLDAMAEKIANGQTLGTLNPTHRAAMAEWEAKVLATRLLDPTPDGHVLTEIDVHFPEDTVCTDLGTLLTVTFGKISMGGPIRLHQLTPSASLCQKLQAGTRHGLEGIRKTTGIPEGRPLLMSIFKPCLGVPVAQLGEVLASQALGGLQLVKDDEILSDPTLDSALSRLDACLSALQKAEAQTGTTLIYVINLTGPAHELISRAQALQAAGARALMFNYLAYGLPTLHALRQAVDIPLFAHPALAGGFYGSSYHGIAPSVLFGTLPRLAGADAVLFPSPYGSVCLPKADALAIQHNLLAPCHDLAPVAPVPSAGITQAMIPEILQDFGTNVIINAGTGVHDHPDGSLAGARAFRHALDVAMGGEVVTA